MPVFSRWVWVWGLLVGAGGATSLGGQSPDDRKMLDAWHDSLQRVTTITVLDRYPERGSTSREATALRRLMYRLRSAQLRHSSGDLERALGGLLLEAGQHPSWPWPPYLLAQSFEWMHRERLFSGGWSGVLPSELLATAAWRNIAVMMSTDPTFPRGREYFFEKLLASGERELQDFQAIPLLAELSRSAPDPRALLVAGRQQRMQGRADSSRQLLRRAELAGEDLSRVALDAARTAAALGDSATARQQYWRGLAALTPAGRVSYRYDLEWLLPPDSLRAFDHLSDDALASWIRAFWEQRDAAAGNPPGTRLQHHLQRWNLVTASFRVPMAWRKIESGLPPAPVTHEASCGANELLTSARLGGDQPSYPGDLRDRERLLDHRGLIYLRRGPPLRVRGVRVASDVAPPTDGSGVLPTTSASSATTWFYYFDGAFQQLSFGGSPPFGTQAPTTLSAVRGLESLPGTPRPQTLPQGMPAALQGTVSGFSPLPPPRGEVTENCPDGSAAVPWHPLARDADPAPFLDVWPARFQAYALGRGAGARVLLSFAVAGDRIGAVSTGSGRDFWPLRVHLVGYQARTGLRVDRDTLLKVYDPPNEQTHGMLTGWLELPVASGAWQFAIRITQGSDSAGVASLQSGIVIPTEGAPAMSDVVMGIDGARVWTAGDQRGFPLNTLGSWQRESPLALYYEVYGLNAGQSYQSTVQLREGGPSGRRVLDMHTTDVASGPTTPVRKVLSLDVLPAGEYLLVVATGVGKVITERRMSIHVTAR